MKKSKILIILIIILAIILLLMKTINFTKTKEDSKITLNEELKTNEIETNETTIIEENMQVEKIKDQYGIQQLENKTIVDENNNTITIPKGYILADPAKNKDIKYKDNENPKIEEGIVITDKVDKSGEIIGNEFVWVPVVDVNSMYNSQTNKANLYSFVEYDQGKLIVNFPPTLIEYSVMEIVEPGLLENYDIDNRNYLSNINLTEKKFKKELEDEFKKMILSVEKYKGFYIGRYETGGLKQGVITKAVVEKGRKDINYTDWYYIYASSKNIKKEGSNVTSSMIWGCQWDAVMNWFLNCNEETKEYATVSGKNGYFNKSNITATGYYEVNNIYDMTGNVSEWTMEADDNGYRTYRGGNYYTEINNQPASYRGCLIPNNKTGSVGSRATLYIK